LLLCKSLITKPYKTTFNNLLGCFNNLISRKWLIFSAEKWLKIEKSEKWLLTEYILQENGFFEFLSIPF